MKDGGVIHISEVQKAPLEVIESVQPGHPILIANGANGQNGQQNLVVMTFSDSMSISCPSGGVLLNTIRELNTEAAKLAS